MLKDLFTPCLILDRGKLDDNIRKIKSIVSKQKIDFRPHLKTAKCLEITKILVKEFGPRAMVSTIEELEQLKSSGINDFLYSVAIVPNKLERIARNLSNNCKITVSVDNISTAQELVTFYKTTGNRITAVIELDLDGHRSGVRPYANEQLIKISKCLDEFDLFRGVMSHAGESYGLSNEEDINNCAKNEANQTLMAAETIQKVGINCELVTIGSTPTALSGSKNIGITELRAGVFIFFDLVQSGVGVCELNEIALSVLTTVISINIEIDAIIVDSGWMALSRDRGTSSQEIDYGYGQVCNEHGELIEDLIVTNVQQEHGIIQVREGSDATLPNLKPGDLLRILPNHACATAAAHSRYHVVNREDKSIKIWDRFSGW